MLKLRSIAGLFSVVLMSLSAAYVAAQGSNRRWLTLRGDEPLVIARGGFSGIFPDSSANAYVVAIQTGLQNVHLWCDVQLTKDGVGICFPDLLLQNASDIGNVYANRENTYNVSGNALKGWFSVDFTLQELDSVRLIQRILSRPPNFDGALKILPVDVVSNITSPSGLWLNIQHDIFFSQHNLSMRKFIGDVSTQVDIAYISSPEVGFLRSMMSLFRRTPTKLIFQFLGPDDVEPSTNRPYSSFLNNLTSIRDFSAGILIPKNYIWPVDNSLYLLNYTNLVVDAHKAGLEVYAYNFANDANLAYDYSFDPVAEYLSYVDNGQFSVDGVLSDYPITPSATIDCYSHIGTNATVQVDLLVISNEGASGDYPGCTDKAYNKAVLDGVDVLDCPVQMTNDGIPFCLGSINLRDRTNVAGSEYGNLTVNNPQLNIQDGIFAYDLTWSQIQSLTPAMYSPYPNFTLFRNPKARNDGKLMQLSEFLAYANNISSISGILISIENAAFLASEQGLGVTDAVLDALSKAGFSNQTAKKVMIKSSESAVLLKFRSSSNYELVYLVDEDVGDILNSTISDIKEFASSVILSKRSVFPTNKLFLASQTNVVPKLQAFNLSVYVQLFQNEFASQPWDVFSDPYFEINQYVTAMAINGVVSDFPATAVKYRRNRCLGYKEPTIYMSPVEPGGLLKLMEAPPPAEAPNPVLTEGDVAESPLPPVANRPTTNVTDGSTAPPPATPQNGEPSVTASIILNSIATLLATYVLS